MVILKVVEYAHPPEALREGQTRREAGAQSDGPLFREVAGLPNRVKGFCGALGIYRLVICRYVDHDASVVHTDSSPRH